jgi:hypothetical protein
MPKVPMPENVRIQEQPAPNLKFDPGMTEEMALAGGKQAEDFGNKTFRLGNFLAAEAEAQAKSTNDAVLSNEFYKFNDTVVDLEVNKTIAADGTEIPGYRTQHGADIAQRKSGQMLSDEYLSHFDEKAKTFEANLTNDYQRERFREKASALRSSFYGGLKKHELNELSNFETSAYKAGIQSNYNMMGLNYTNKNALDLGISEIEGATIELGVRQGKSRAESLLDSKAVWGKALIHSASEAIKNGSVDHAEAIMNTYKDRMDADSYASMLNVVKPAIDRRDVDRVIESVVNEKTRSFNPGNMEVSIFPHLINQESTGNQFRPDGMPMISKKGAIGKYQVMPKTGEDVAKSLGIPWDEKLFYATRTGDPIKDKEIENYNQQLGQGYFKMLYKQFDGDLEKSLAAYNSGPGTVKNAVDVAEVNGDGANWKNYLKDFQSADNNEETLKYVSSISSKIKESDKTTSFLDHIPSKLEFREIVMNRLGPDSSGDKKDYAESQLNRWYSDLVDARKKEKDDAFNEAAKILSQTRGDMSKLSLDVLNKLDPVDRPKLQAYAQKEADGLYTTNPVKFSFLMSNDSYLSKLTREGMEKLRTTINAKDMDTLYAKWGLLTGNTGSSEDKDKLARYEDTAKLVDIAIRSAVGREFKGSKDASEVIAREAMIRSINDQVDAHEASTKEKIKPKEKERLINDTMFSRAVENEGFFSNFLRTGRLRNQERMPVLSDNPVAIRMKQEVDDQIPAATIKKYTKEFKEKKGYNPTAIDLLSRYYSDQRDDLKDAVDKIERLKKE